MDKKTLGFIPARGGSKGVPGKNIAPVAGKPLIAWVIESALKSRYLDDLLLSSDDDKIINIAEGLGVEAPFKRPDELAQDNSLVIDVIIHALDWLKINRKKEYDYVCIVQPTAPLTASEDYDNAVKTAIEKNADTVITVQDTGHFHPALMHTLDDAGGASWYVDNPDWDRMSRRQDLPPVYSRCGNVYVIKTSLILNHRTLYGEKIFACVIPPQRAIDIDTPIDLKLAELMLREREG